LANALFVNFDQITILLYGTSEPCSFANITTTAKLLKLGWYAEIKAQT
jgi:hypothetical protein